MVIFMEIRKIELTDETVSRLISLSENWEHEDITWGLHANSAGTFAGMRVFGAYDGGELVGYLVASSFRTDCPYAMTPDVGTPCWEIEELYVSPAQRSRGIGRALYEYAELAAKRHGAEYVFLSTATKDYRRILHFYIDELGMEFWTARLFKKL